MSSQSHSTRHLRRDGDSPGLAEWQLWVRQLREYGADLRQLRTVTETAWDFVGTSRRITRYHLGHAFQPLNSTRVVPLQVKVNQRRMALSVRLNGSDLHVFREIYLHDSLRDLVDLADLANAKVIVDLGSNVGLATAYLACWAPTATFWCVEPAAENNVIASRNAVANGIDATFETVAISGRSGEIEFYSNAWWASSTTVESVHRSRTSRPERFESSLLQPSSRVSAYSVGDYLATHDIGQIDLMKMDIEGAEAEVFQGDCSWLDAVSRLAVEIHSKYIDPAPVRDTLRRHGLHRIESAGPLELYGH